MSHIGETHCASINDSNVLLSNLLDGYNKNVRPVENQKKPVLVNVTLLLNSIHELDEIGGIFSVMGIMKMNWFDASMVWDPAMYGDVDHVMTSYKDVWVPELILINPAEESDTLGKNWQRVYFYKTGFAAWLPGGLIKSTCKINVYKYPFDTQKCTLTFSAWGYYSSHIKLNASLDEVNVRFYTESATWTLIRSQVKTSGRDMEIQFAVFLKRKSSFVIVNVLLPLTFLNLLNILVFLLSPESGEKISYCITVLLAIAVFMTIVSDTLPKSSEPVPVISYKLIVDMVSSSLMTFVTILNLRLYYKNDGKDVPNWLKQLYNILCCHRTKCNIHAVVDTETKRRMFENDNKTSHMKEAEHEKLYNTSVFTDISSISIMNNEDDSLKSKDAARVEMMAKVHQKCNCNAEVNWQNISSMADGIAFVVFTLISVGSLILFFVITM